MQGEKYSFASVQFMFVFLRIRVSGFGVFHSKWTNLNTVEISVWFDRSRWSVTSCYVIIIQTWKRLLGEPWMRGVHRRVTDTVVASPCDLPHFPISSSSIAVSHKLINFQSRTLQEAFYGICFLSKFPCISYFECRGGMHRGEAEGADRALWASSTFFFTTSFIYPHKRHNSE